MNASWIRLDTNYMRGEEIWTKFKQISNLDRTRSPFSIQLIRHKLKAKFKETRFSEIVWKSSPEILLDRMYAITLTFNAAVIRHSNRLSVRNAQLWNQLIFRCFPAIRTNRFLLRSERVNRLENVDSWMIRLFVFVFSLK